MFRSFRSFATLAAVALVAAACADSPVAPNATATQVEAESEADFFNLPGTVVDIALSDPNFSTLVAAVVAADLVDALSAPGQRTVFAPTNEAFAALGLNADNIATALTKEQLTSILTYHVTPGRRPAFSLLFTRRLNTLNGEKLRVRKTRDGLRINDSNVIAANVRAKNGIVHVIDAVLLPPAN